MGDGSKSFSCSEYPRSSFISDTGMRVNCQPSTGLNSRVIIQSRTDQGFSISEIEVHTLGKYKLTNDNINS